MPDNFHILVDSDAFVGRFYPNDSHHQQASRLFAQYEARHEQLVTTNLVILETATVLSHRSQSLACRFLDVIERNLLPIIQVDEPLQAKAIKLFKAQTKKGTSMVDCANAAISHHLQIPQIFSFDKVYPKKFGLQLATG